MAIVTFDAAAAYLRATYPPWNSTAQTLLNAFQFASARLREMDPYWCWAVTDDFTCATSHDGVVSTIAQFFPQRHKPGVHRARARPGDRLLAGRSSRDVFTNVLARPATDVAVRRRRRSAPSGPGSWSLVRRATIAPRPGSGFTERRLRPPLPVGRQPRDLPAGTEEPVWAAGTAGTTGRPRRDARSTATW